MKINYSLIPVKIKKQKRDTHLSPKSPYSPLFPSTCNFLTRADSIYIFRNSSHSKSEKSDHGSQDYLPKISNKNKIFQKRLNYKLNRIKTRNSIDVLPKMIHTHNIDPYG